MGVVETEEDVELEAEGAVKTLAAEEDFDGGGMGGEVYGAEPALTDHRRGEISSEGFDLRPVEAAGGVLGANRRIRAVGDSGG